MPVRVIRSPKTIAGKFENFLISAFQFCLSESTPQMIKHFSTNPLRCSVSANAIDSNVLPSPMLDRFNHLSWANPKSIASR